MKYNLLDKSGKVILKNQPQYYILGWLNNRNIIDLNYLYEDKSQENRLWYDDGNDYRYEPKPISRRIKLILNYFNITDYKIEEIK